MSLSLAGVFGRAVRLPSVWPDGVSGRHACCVIRADGQGTRPMPGGCAARHGMRPRAEVTRLRAAPLRPRARPRPHSPRRRHQRNHATCVMALHANWREAPASSHEEGCEFNANQREAIRCTRTLADREWHGDGAVQRVCAGAHPRDAGRRVPGPVMSSARGAGRAGDHLDGAPTAHRLTPRLGEDPLMQEGSPVQVPVTVQPPTNRFIACVVRR
jgi:hypothetical protein